MAALEVWLVTIGEPLPFGDGAKDRPYRTGLLAKELVRAGHRVTWWVSAFDHFRRALLFNGDSHVQLEPGLELILLNGGGYRRNISIARLLDHRRLATAFRRAAPGQKRPDVIVASLPPLELAHDAVRFGVSRGIPVLLDLRDMWPDLFIEYVPGGLRRMARLGLTPLFRNCHEAMREATGLSAMTEQFLAWGLQGAGRSRRRSDGVFPLAYSEEGIPDGDRAKASAFWDAIGVPRTRDRLRICYSGALGVQFRFEPILEAARILERQNAPVQFVICGAGERAQAYRQMAADLNTVVFPGWVNAAQAREVMSRSQIGLDPMPDRFDFLATVNNKAIEYLNAGLAILSTPETGALASLVRAEACGWALPQGDVKAMVNLIAGLAAEPERLRLPAANAARLCETRFRADRVYGSMRAHIEEMALTSPRDATSSSPG